ncbi:MAG: hypothetical protein KDB00_21635 [Planctomycetales bacterium]|nr:hypothetical protein [Planctomycetales bacterium]
MGRSRLASLSLPPAAFVAIVLMCPLTGFAQTGLPQPGIAQPMQLPSPDNPTYVELAKCAACHFEQYKDWRGSEHHRAFEILPLKYRNDASCLKCHTTGTPGDASSYQYGVSCQACHGPGQAHANFALQSAQMLLTEEGLTTLRGKIHRLDMRQCVTCHISKAHKKHPPFDRDPATPRVERASTTSFFQEVHGAKATPQ